MPFASAPAQVAKYRKLLSDTVGYLRTKKRVLFLTTSNRFEGEKEHDQPKSTLLAQHIAKLVGSTVEIIDVASLNIYVCEGNVSSLGGNKCGVHKALLKDKEKNPSGLHRCWASFNNKDDELWKISKPLFASDCVVFFASIRWGQANSIYQKLIERLTWIENRHSSLGESNIVKKIDVGLIFTGHNWHGANVLKTQKSVLSFFGFHVVPQLCWNWQYTDDAKDETLTSYKKATGTFRKTFLTHRA